MHGLWACVDRAGEKGLRDLGRGVQKVCGRRGLRSQNTGGIETNLVADQMRWGQPKLICAVASCGAPKKKRTKKRAPKTRG